MFLRFFPTPHCVCAVSRHGKMEVDKSLFGTSFPSTVENDVSMCILGGLVTRKIFKTSNYDYVQAKCLLCSVLSSRFPLRFDTSTVPVLKFWDTRRSLKSTWEATGKQQLHKICL